MPTALDLDRSQRADPFFVIASHRRSNPPASTRARGWIASSASPPRNDGEASTAVGIIRAQAVSTGQSPNGGEGSQGLGDLCAGSHHYKAGLLFHCLHSVGRANPCKNGHG